MPWLSFLLALVGFVSPVSPKQAVGRSWRIVVEATERTELVESGMFRWSRNPVFVPMIVTNTRFTRVVPNAVQLAALACVVIAVQVQARWVEEPTCFGPAGPPTRSTRRGSAGSSPESDDFHATP